MLPDVPIAAVVAQTHALVATLVIVAVAAAAVEIPRVVTTLAIVAKQVRHAVPGAAAAAVAAVLNPAAVAVAVVLERLALLRSTRNEYRVVMVAAAVELSPVNSRLVP